MNLDDDWREILRLAGGQVTPEQVDQIIAISRGTRGTWPWVGLFSLADGRAAYVYGQQARAGWQDTTSKHCSAASISIAPTVDEAMLRIHGDSFIALHGQYLAWCTRRSASALLQLLDDGIEVNWALYTLQTPGTSEGRVYAYAPDVERARRDGDDKDVQVLSSKRGFGMIVPVRYLVDVVLPSRAPSTPLRRGPLPRVPVGMKRCESCKNDHPLDETERAAGRQADDFWRCENCMSQLARMLDVLSNSLSPRLFTRRDRMRETLSEYEEIYQRSGQTPSQHVREVVERLRALDLETCPRAAVDFIVTGHECLSGLTAVNCSICDKDVDETVRFGGRPTKLCRGCVDKLQGMFGGSGAVIP